MKLDISVASIPKVPTVAYVSEFETGMRTHLVDSSQSSQYMKVQFSDKLQPQS
jgi:hypothetical protein